MAITMKFLVIINVLGVLTFLFAAAWLKLKELRINSCSKEIKLIYKSINSAIKNGKQLLEINVDHIHLDDFVPFYKGLTEFYRLDVDLKSRRLDDNSYSEYILINLSKYHKIKNKLTPVMIQHEDLTKFQKSNKFSEKELYLSQPLAEVIDLQAYKRARQLKKAIVK
jgi:hypothetical protein